MNTILRLLGTLVIAVAVVFAVGDIARSLADEAMRLITVAEALASLGLDPASGAQSNPFLVWLVRVAGSWSMTLTTAVIGFALLIAGRKSRHDRIARR